MQQQQFNRNVQHQRNLNEMLDGLVTTSNVPKNDFLQVFANTLFEQSSKALLIQSQKSASTIEKNQLLLNQLNYQNGIHYSVSNNIT